MGLVARCPSSLPLTELQSLGRGFRGREAFLRELRSSGWPLVLTMILLPRQELRLRLESSQEEAARLREQLSGYRQELRASQRLLQDRAQEHEDLLGQLEAQRQEAQHCQSSIHLLER